MLKKESFIAGKSKKKIKSTLTHPVIIRTKLEDHSNDPFFLKKEEQAWKTLQETPLPEFLLRR